MKTEKALFAAGCFWAVQHYFDQIPGVVKTTVGYTGGHMTDPTYEDVSYKETGHAEAVLVEFDPQQVMYETLVKQFFYMHDPTQLNQQGPDVGEQYRSAVFFMNETQRKTAEAVRDELQRGSDKPFVTEVTKASKFYSAEDYHQKFAEKTGHGMCPMPFRKM
jgi:methionine-S-sulfoxide reductase